jgi:hypothetical protein
MTNWVSDAAFIFLNFLLAICATVFAMKAIDEVGSTATMPSHNCSMHIPDSPLSMAVSHDLSC